VTRCVGRIANSLNGGLRLFSVLALLLARPKLLRNENENDSRPSLVLELGADEGGVNAGRNSQFIPPPPAKLVWRRLCEFDRDCAGELIELEDVLVVKAISLCSCNDIERTFVLTFRPISSTTMRCSCWTTCDTVALRTCFCTGTCGASPTKNSPTTPVHATNAFSSAGSAWKKAFDTPTAEGSSEKSELSSLEAEMSSGTY